MVAADRASPGRQQAREGVGGIALVDEFAVLGELDHVGGGHVLEEAFGGVGPAERKGQRRASENASAGIYVEGPQEYVLQAVGLLGGAVVVEQVFAIPGLGQLAIAAVSRRDLTMIQGIVVLSAVVVFAFSVMR